MMNQREEAFMPECTDGEHPDEELADAIGDPVDESEALGECAHLALPENAVRLDGDDD